MTDLEAAPGSRGPATRATLGPAYAQDQVNRDRQLWVAVVAAVVCLTALFAVARMADLHADRARPMYRDVLSLAWLEYGVLHDGGRPDPVRLGAGDSTTIGGHRLTVSPGVTVRVKVSGDGFCVRGANQYGDTTGWQCGDARTRPPELGALGSLS